MKRLNTKPYDCKILQFNTQPGAKVKNAASFRPAFDVPGPEQHQDTEHLPKKYSRHELGLALQGELERRFIVLCEAVYLDNERKMNTDAVLITEAVARYKEVYFLMERMAIPQNFIYNTPADYCNFFLISEEKVRETITKNAGYLATHDGYPVADTMILQDYLRKLNNEF